MANPRGTFAPELLPEGWFDETLRPEGWFSQDFLEPATVAGAYSLTVSSSAITLAGSTVNLRRAAKLTVSSAAIALATSTVGPKVGRKVAVTANAITLAGQSVALRSTRRLPVTTTAIAIFGSAVNLKAGRSVSVAPASVTLSGSNVGLTYTPQGNAYSLVVTAGAISLSGQSVGLKSARRLSVAPAAVTLAGSNVTLIKTGSYRVTIDPAAIVLAGGEIGLSAQASGGGAGQNNRGDDVSRRKRPIIFIRPKLERDLDDILEVIDAVQETDRVSDNKRKLRVATQALKSIEPPPDYAKAMAAIASALDKVTRSTAKHEGLKQSLATVSIQLEAVIAEMQERRKRRQRDDEALLWLI